MEKHQTTFWKRFSKLCLDINKSPNAVCKELNFSNATATHWKNGSIPNDVAKKVVSDYFGVTVDYLLGNTEEIKKEPDKKSGPIQSRFTDHELNIINAYRAQPDLQTAVDRLLGVESDGKIFVYTAAYSDDKRPDAYVQIDKDIWEKIQDAPETDDTLM